MLAHVISGQVPVAFVGHYILITTLFQCKSLQHKKLATVTCRCMQIEMLISIESALTSLNQTKPCMSAIVGAGPARSSQRAQVSQLTAVLPRMFSRDADALNISGTSSVGHTTSISGLCHLCLRGNWLEAGGFSGASWYQHVITMYFPYGTPRVLQFGPHMACVELG